MNSLFKCVFNLFVALILLLKPAITFPDQSPQKLKLSEQERTWLANSPEIVVGVKRGWAPIEFISDDLKFHGFSIEYLNMMESMLGVKFKFVPYENNLPQNHYDVISAVNEAAAGAQLLDEFSLIYPAVSSTEYGIFSTLNNKNLYGIEALAGKRISTFKPSPLTSIIAEYHPEIDLYSADIAEEALHMLFIGEVDAYVGNPLIIQYVINNDVYENVVQTGSIPYKANIHMAVRKDWPHLVTAMNKAMLVIQHYKAEEIHDKYLKPNKHNHKFLKISILVILISVGVITVFYLANRRLRKEINERIIVENSLLIEKDRAEASEKKLAEYAIEIERLALVATKTQNSVMITDGAGLTTWVNAAFTRNTGFEPMDIIGKKPGVLLQGPETSDEAISIISEAIRSRKPCILDIVNYKKNGEKFWVSMSLSPVLNSSGENMFIAVLNDITRQKEFIDEIENQRNELDALFSLSDDGIVFVDGLMSVSKVNQAFIKLLGIPEDQVLNHPLIDVDNLIKRYLPHHEVYKSMVSTIEASESSYKDMQPLPEYMFELESTPKKILKRSFIPVNQSDLLGIFYFSDITHERRVEKMKSEFISTAAHELRTPMAIIYGYAELIKTRKLSQYKIKDMIDGIWKSTRHVVEMLDDLLDLAIIEQRSANVMIFKNEAIKPFLENIVDHYQWPTNQNRIQFHTVGDLGMYRFDKAKLERAIINCLNNAYKFSNHDAFVELRAEINNQAGNKILMISIVDHGVGIKPEELPRIFERFFRGDQSGNIPGTGLGLPLVKEIIEAHGGWVEVQSQWMEGTCIKLCLPLNRMTDQT